LQVIYLKEGKSMLCIHCSKKIPDGSAFCTVCGKSQQQEQSGTTSTDLVTSKVSGYENLIKAHGGIQDVKQFEGLYTQIAVSSNGYLAVYYPPVPAVKGNFILKGSPEQRERLEVLHISQITDFDFDVEGEEETKVSGGFGGALVGGLLGGTVGSIIGSAATSGKVKTKTTITGVNLIISTKDFSRPRIEVRLFSPFSVHNIMSGGTETAELPHRLRLHCMDSKGRINNAGILDNDGKKLAKEVFNNGEIPTEQITALQSTLTQLLAAQQQSELAATVAPQLSTADELAKYKDLLDGGVITQEEFDAKKKQLLGL
jgi:hypothetical protein